MRTKLILLSTTILLTACQTMSDVDRGLYAVADSIAKPDIITGERTANLASRDKQIESGNANALQAIKQYGDNINGNVDRASYERLQNVFNKVHSVTHYRDEPWQVILIPDPSFNAFATGGTIIVVNMGVFDVIHSDDELAALLGHEMGHITANHVAEKQATMLTKVRHRKSSKAQIFEMAFTVDQEREADKLGILYSALAGYDPFAASQLWSNISKKYGNNADIFSDHPMNSERSIATNNIATKVKQYYTPNQINPNFATILESNTLWQKNTLSNNVSAGSGGGVLAVAETAANTMKKISEANLEQAKQIQRMNFVRSVSASVHPTGWDIIDDTSYKVYFQYTGNLPIKNLAIKARYGIDFLLFQYDGIIVPNQKFTAVFQTNEPLQRYKVIQAYSIDSVEVAN